MKRILLAVLVVAVVGTSSCNRSPEDSKIGFVPRMFAHLRARIVGGKSELQKMEAARLKARSFKMETEMRLHPGVELLTVAEVSCPGSEHLLGMVKGEARYEEIRMGNETYYKPDPAGDYTKYPLPDKALPCDGNPGLPAAWAMLNEGRDTADSIAKLVESGRATLSPGEYVDVAGERCQEWQVAFSHPNGAGKDPKMMSGMMYTICINPDTHLPRQVRMGNNGGFVTTYSAWGQAFPLSAPEKWVPAPPEEPQK